MESNLILTKVLPRSHCCSFLSLVWKLKLRLSPCSLDWQVKISQEAPTGSAGELTPPHRLSLCCSGVKFKPNCLHSLSEHLFLSRINSSFSCDAHRSNNSALLHWVQFSHFIPTQNTKIITVAKVNFYMYECGQQKVLTPRLTPSLCLNQNTSVHRWIQSLISITT